ncbi:hypothetical protein COB21_01075 [Candidatus Aerophobetes bacterium]|uniref:Uncharacterized protein n=1 Tax=Aerophobetes bacterium TaxID=2030807 RepID=A0A2A4X6G7_UNCAE|nr:MAG: hypothetical protein COB21_01075 [Candidatus Aerophobetes bacterium]
MRWIPSIIYSSLAACLLVASPVVAREDARETFYSSHTLNQHQWISYELFENFVGVSSSPIDMMMRQLAPEEPEIWDQYSACVGNLLLANLYLNTDIEKVTKAIYTLRFHSEMTYACIYNALLLSLSNPNSFLASNPSILLEMFTIASLMENALENCPEHDDSGISPMCALVRFKCLELDQNNISTLPIFQIPYLKVSDFLQSQSNSLDQLQEGAPFYFQHSSHTFVPTSTTTSSWGPVRDIVDIKEEFDNEKNTQLYRLEVKISPHITFLKFLEKHFVSFLELPSFGKQLANELEQFQMPQELREIDEEMHTTPFFIFDDSPTELCSTKFC